MNPVSNEKMKHTFYLLACILAFSSIGAWVHQKMNHRGLLDPVPGSCTIFSASVGDKVLFGNNEDYYKPKTYYWTEPATEGNYGCLYVGFKDYSHQGGINEKGLCFDANALPKAKIQPHAELAAPPCYPPPHEDVMIWVPVLLLRKAATVAEAIEIANRYQRKNWYPNSGEISYQVNLADATGDAVVISVDKNGELAFTRKEKGTHYLISTNFNKANPENALEYPCPRYDTAEEILQSIKTENDLTIDIFKSLLNSVHVEGIFNNTLYSNIFDLKNGVVYLYHWHQFEEVAMLNVAEELAKGEVYGRIADLFSTGTVDNAFRAYIGSIFILCISSMVGVGLMVLVLHSLKKGIRKGNAEKDVLE